MRRSTHIPFAFRNAFVSFVPFVSFVFLFVHANVYAQPPDAIGVRAQGMGGAFTAVADDATASWWNPAGLANGAYLSMIAEYGEVTDAPVPDQPFHRGVAIAFPALGLSYYRTTVSEIGRTDSIDTGSGSRQDPGTPSVRSLDVSQFGVTVGQSIGNHLVVASTLKLLRGEGETQAGLDVGVMYALHRSVRVGLAVRNAREATFGSEDLGITLRRQVRAGAAWSSGARTAYGGATVAFDADLRRIPTVVGEERRIAAGAELWTKRRFLGGRVGVSASAIGDRREAYSGGLSLALRPGLYADGTVTRGSDVLRRGWTAALRVTF
jgi:hypothetical protein